MYVNEEYKIIIKNKVDRIKTRLWFSIVQYHANAKNPNNLDRRIYELECDNNFGYYIQSKAWYKYEKAEIIPELTTINRINKILPQTAYYFNHPLWTILNYDSYSFLEITHKISDLDSNICNKIIYIENISNAILRRQPITLKLLKQIEDYEALDVLYVLFLLYSEEIDKSSTKRKILKNFFEKYLKSIQQYPQFKFTNSIVFDFIFNFFKSLEFKNTLNFVYDEDLILYNKLPRENTFLDSYSEYYEINQAFNKIRDDY